MVTTAERLLVLEQLQCVGDALHGWRLVVASATLLFRAAMTWSFPGPVRCCSSLEELRGVLSPTPAVPSGSPAAMRQPLATTEAAEVDPSLGVELPAALRQSLIVPKALPREEVQRPDARLLLVISDNLPDATTAEVLRCIDALVPPERRRIIYVLSDGADSGLLKGLLAAGVHGLCRASELGKGRVYGAMAAIAGGGLWVDPLFLKRLHHRSAGSHSSSAASLASDPQALTARERQLLRAVCEGYNSIEIARRLHISRHSVRRHLSQAYQRIGVRDRTQAVGWCIAQGLVTATDLRRIYRPSVPG